MPATADDAHRRPRRWVRWALGLTGLALAIAYPLPFQSSGVLYFQTVGFLVLLYSALGIAWNIIGGWCGQFDFGPMVFFGVGAYGMAAAVKFFGLNPWVGFAAAAVFTVVFAAIVTFPITRLRDHYFAIATNAIWLIALPIATNWELIGGSRGLFIPLVRKDTFLAQLVSLQPGGRTKELVFYYLVLGYFLVVLLLASRLEHTKFGYCFKAVRDDEEGAQALGIHTRAYKVIARCCTAGIYAVGGGIFTMWALSVFPDQVFDINWGLLPTIAVVLGGIGRLWGAVVGCVILVPISQLISTYLGTGPLAGRGIDLIVYGLLIMIVAAARPQGLLSLPWRRWLGAEAWAYREHPGEHPPGSGRSP
jgi:branched-chain amino acid transport system permease protein